MPELGKMTELRLDDGGDGLFSTIKGINSDEGN